MYVTQGIQDTGSLDEGHNSTSHFMVRDTKKGRASLDEARLTVFSGLLELNPNPPIEDVRLAT